MANSATAGSPTGIFILGAKECTVITPYLISLDADEDLTVLTPSNSRHVGVFGIDYSDDTDHTLIIKSGSTAISTQYLLAKTPNRKPISPYPELVTYAGQALVVRCAAAIQSLTLYVAEYKELYLR